jgi:hypothetical protein
MLRIPGLVSRLLIGLIIAPILSPIFASIGISEQFSYANERLSLALETKGAQTIQLSNEMTSFTIALTSPTPIIDEDTVAITLSSKGVRKKVGLEISGNEEGIYYTAPLHFAPTSVLSIECTREGQSCGDLELIALNTRATTSKLSFGTPSHSQIYAEDDTIVGNLADRIPGVNVISRAQWGADETLRYEEWAVWKRIRAAQAIAREKALKEGIKPSEATLKVRAKNSAIEEHLRSNFPEEFVRSEVIRKEWNNSLVWPIEKSKNVRKIVLHHTAESNPKGLSDMDLMRSMYYYHTVVRGWGDFGYHYIVGQRGQVYEWRAGGDYAVGAHTNWNNSSTVGVSVIGNFETDRLVKEQKAALPIILGGLARKYGIDTNTSIMGHRACKVDDLCNTTDSLTLGIVGHRDIGATSCPGTNLYNFLLDNLRPKLAEQTRGYTLIANSVYRPETLARPIENPLKPTENTLLVNPTNLNKGPPIRIKLSISELDRIDLEVLEGNPILTFDTTNGMTQTRTLSIAKSKKPGAKNLELTLDGKKYRGKLAAFAGTLVRVNNWDRKPSWDTSGKLNDNVFRGKLEVRVEGGKLILINELPLEDYLKWIAETSNGDARAKVETIIIAARSYAYYYTQTGAGAERKFVGKSYDGSDDPDVFQKYLGYGYEKRSPTTAAIVEATNGKIITYEGAPIKPWYFSQSDGQTLSALQYCEGRKSRGEISATALCRDIPYLQWVADPGSAGQTRKGHGVGISGLGSTYYAREGWSSERIIQYYLKGVAIEKKY